MSGGGSTSIDLRNLGASRVLILVNGKRVASFADALANQSVDLTFVPTAMIERVDILRDGASAAYGADAITGVVNIILKENFEGVEIGASTGLSGEGDGQRYGVDFAMGTTSDRGSMVLGMEYRYNNSVNQRDRAWAFPAISSLNSGGAQNGSFFSPGGVYFGTNGLFCTQPVAFGGDEITNVANTTGCPSFAARQNVSDPDDVVLNRYDYSLQQDGFGQSEVYTFAGYGVYEMFDGVEAYLEAEYSKRQSEFHLDGNPGAFNVPGTNPNLVDEFGVDLGAGSFFVRPTTTVGIRASDHESDTIRIVGGLRGDIVSEGFFNEWSWDVSYLFTRVDADLRTNSTFNVIRFERIADPAQCAIDPICAATVNPSGALDILRPGNWTQDEIAYVRQNSIARSEFETTGWQGVITGPVFELPAGDVQVAFGAEQRTDTGFNKPDPVTEAGESVANQVFTTIGDFTVFEYFAEVDIPILADVPGFQNLDLNAQFRSSDFDTFGEETVWRLGLNWQIIDSVRLRATMSTAYRAPQVTDLFGGGVSSFDFVSHPCTDSTANLPGSNVEANCILAGVPATANEVASQSEVLAGGNPDLEPETADTASYGIVFTPSFLEGFSASIDFFDITVEDLITRPQSDSVVDACFEGPVGLTAPECARFDSVYNPISNNLTTENLTNRLANDPDDNVSTKGFDLGAHYQFAGPWDTNVNLDFQGTYVDANDFFPGAGGADGRGSIPRIKANLIANVDWEAWDFTWRTRYIHSMTDPDFTRDTNTFGYENVPSHTEHDIRIGWNQDKYRVVFGVNDLFDNDPPYVFNSGNNTDLFLYDFLGRYMFLRATATM